MKTYSAKPGEIEHSWFVVDASGKTLGRLASAIASHLRGKHKPEFTPHVDTGDFVVVVNAGKVHVTGNKAKDKIYHHHTGYPGGLKSISFGKLMEKAPEQAIEMAVKGMLPKNPLGRAMALYLAGRGHDVAVHFATSGAEAGSVVAEIRALGRKAVALQADLLVESQVETLIPRAAQALGLTSKFHTAALPWRRTNSREPE